MVSALVVGGVAGAVPAAATTSAGPVDVAGDAMSVTLPTGDHVTISGGKYTFSPLAGHESAARTFVDGSGDHYVVPAIAQPYLGTALDRSLFDVSALVRDGLGTGQSLPVRLTFAGGVTPTAPPGVTLTSVTGQSATGFLTQASGADLAAALRARIGADVTAGRPAGSSPLAGGLTSMSLAAAGAPLAAQPFFPLHILQINGLDETGQPIADGSAQLIDTDSITRETLDIEIVDGTARVAVPSGDYSLFYFVFDFDDQGNVTDSRVVTMNDVTVSDDPTTSVTVDERAATIPIKVSTPRPAAQQAITVDFGRGDTTGQVFTDSLLVQTTPVYVNAQPAPTVGTMRYLVQWNGAPPTGNYRYDVAFAAADIPADESFVVRRDQLATVREHYSLDPAGETAGLVTDSAVDPGITNIFDQGISQDMPADVTDYLGTADGGGWQQSDLPDEIQLDGDPRTFSAGHDYSIDWAHGPLVSALGHHTGGLQICLACVAGNTLTLGQYPISDSAGHIGRSGGTTHLTLYRDGSQIADMANVFAAQIPDIPAEPSTFRLVFDLDRTAADVSQSTVVHTDVTVPYTPTAAGTTLPAENICGGQSASSPCTVLPALTVGYQLASDDTNTSGLPIQSLGLTVGHTSYDGVGSHAAITSAGVSVSFDNGATWTRATVHGFRGDYAVTWRNPRSAQSTSPWLRVTATDAVGGSITQTIQDAYTVAPATR